MKLKKYFPSLRVVELCLISLGSFSINAQALERSVVAAAGQSFSNPAYSLKFTIGEPVTQTLVNGNELSQGFQQEWLVITAVEDPGVESLDALVYPNPTFGKVNIETDEQVRMSVFDGFGKSVYTESISSGKSEFDITQYAAGFYILVLQNKEGNKVSTFKLQKVE